MRLVALLLVWHYSVPSVLAFCAVSGYMAYPTTLRLNRSSRDHQKRWMNLLHSDNVHEPWPRSPPKNYHYIRYCFATEAMRGAAKCLVDDAISLWATALGGHASERNQHGLVIKEVVDDHKQPVFCYSSGSVDKDGQNGQWTDGLGHETLVIWVMEQEHEMDEATIGYAPDSVNDKPGRHYLKISRDTVDAGEKDRVAHEFGHVIGMGHEQQRKDRDNYLDYDCTRVRGYADAFKKYHVENPGRPDSDLCTDMQLAKKYNILLTAFVPDKFADVFTSFDFESIMLYDSKTGAEHSACESDIDHCPMLKINKNDKGEVTGLARFGENTVPSKGDARFVRSNYRFKAPEDGTLPDVPPKKSSLRPTPTPAPPPPLPPRPGMSPSPSPAGAPPLPPRPSVTTAM